MKTDIISTDHDLTGSASMGLRAKSQVDSSSLKSAVSIWSAKLASSTD